MNRSRAIILGVLFAILLVAIPLTIYIVSTQEQDVRSRANFDTTTTTTIALGSTTSPSPTVVSPTTAATATPACQTPTAPTNVKITYPNCPNGVCNYTQAVCTWDAVTGAVSYTIKITQIDSGNVIKTDSVTAPTVQEVFPVEQNKTYKCDVSATNSCATPGPSSSFQLTCKTDAIISTPTTASTVTPIPSSVFSTSTPVATRPPRPTLPATGDTSTTVLIGIGGIAVAIIGGAFFLLAL